MLPHVDSYPKRKFACSQTIADVLGVDPHSQFPQLSGSLFWFDYLSFQPFPLPSVEIYTLILALPDVKIRKMEDYYRIRKKITYFVISFRFPDFSFKALYNKKRGIPVFYSGMPLKHTKDVIDSAVPKMQKRNTGWLCLLPFLREKAKRYRYY